ncbi:hypothetical protein ACFL52_03005 [Candidatus Margulisiibacteriota bacterium]
MNLTGREKATIFLSILGSDAASRVLRYLPEELADVIATSVTHLPTPTPEALGAVLEEFRGYLSLGPAKPPPVQIEEPIDVKEVPKSPLEALNLASAKKLAYIFSFEKPLIVAFILSRLKEEKKVEVANNLGSQKILVEELLQSVKINSFTPVIEEKIIKIFSEKV